MCPEFLETNEADFSPAALSANVVAEPEPPAYITRKVFLNHCSEDKETVVRPIARALQARGIDYWLDEAEIRLGDSLAGSINRGLREADYVLCVISDSFLDKGWPKAELGAGLSREFGGTGGRVLPLAVAEVNRVIDEYPLVADKRMALWSDGIPALVAELEAVIRRDAENCDT